MLFFLYHQNVTVNNKLFEALFRDGEHVIFTSGFSMCHLSIHTSVHANQIKGALYRIWCGGNRLGDSGVKVM